MQRSTLGVGTALRKMREGRGLTLEEAARDTRVRPEFLEAIEAEEFDRLLGDVHVRGCLRTYATYLRLSPDKVVSLYEVEHAEPDTPPVAPPPVRTEPVVGRRRRRDDHRLFILVAATVIVLAAAFGILSARRPAPPPADLPAEAGVVMGTAPEIAPRNIVVGVVARRPVEVTVVADGSEAESFALEADEGRSFEADETLTIRLSEGATVRLTVNGTDHGFPGKAGKRWRETFSFDTPSATGS
ncbi:MAG TPA: helix-turn-helix transcriptional regulator [Actinomycetota bacterium]|jgi:hypothetical protein